MTISDTTHTLIDKVLAFVDKPWKAIAVIATLLIGGLLYIVFLQRAELTDLLTGKTKSYVAPALNPATFTRETEWILVHARADAVSVYSIDMVTNTLALRAFKGHGPVGPPGASPRAVIGNDEDATLFLGLFQSRYNCFDPAELSRLEAVTDVERGLHRVCLVMVPPVPPLALGLVVVGWQTALSPVAEREAVLNIQGAAERMATW